jgi:hypothetical protein
MTTLAESFKAPRPKLALYPGVCSQGEDRKCSAHLQIVAIDPACVKTPRNDMIAR